MNRRRRPRAHTNHERWLVSYADFITLLFAFFVVLYASAQVDQRKVGRLALAIQVAFQELGVFPASTTNIPLDTEEPMPFSTVQAIENAKHNTELGRVASPPEDSLTASSQEANLTTLQAELQQALHHEIAMHTVALHRETEGLVISLREFAFFDSGSAAPSPLAMPALDRIASILAVRTCRLRIEGHTDRFLFPHSSDDIELGTLYRPLHRAGPSSDRAVPLFSGSIVCCRIRRIPPDRQ